MKAIIFDYDGTIANNRHFHTRAIQYAAQNLELPFEDDDFLKFFSGTSLVEGTRNFLVHHKKPELQDQFVEFKKSFDKYYDKEVRISEGALELIEKLHKVYDLAITTSSRRPIVDIFLKKFKLDDYFKTIITAENCIDDKPHPEPYLKTIEKLGVFPHEAWAVEDSPRGIESAKAAGLYCVAITNTREESELKQADRIIHKFKELEPILLSDHPVA